MAGLDASSGLRQSLLAVHDRSRVRVRVRRSCGRSGSSAAGLRSSAARWFAPTLAVVNELSEAELGALIAQATVDCYNEGEELAGFAVMIEDNLAMPFETTVLGVTVTVKKIGQTESGIVAICVRGKHRQAIAILDLPLPEDRKS